MKKETERIFNNRVKSMVENTDFEESLNQQLVDEGLDKTPEFDMLVSRRAPIIQRISRAWDSRLFRVACFFFAVFVVSSAMTIGTNSEFVSAGKFQLNNFLFSIKNGFLISDSNFNTTDIGKELLIENEEQIVIGSDYLKELKVPGYIPDDYRFLYLKITNNHKNEYNVTYAYENSTNGMIVISQEKSADYNRGTNIVGIEDDFYIGEAQIFHIPDVVSGYNTIYALTEFETIVISGLFELDDLIKIFEMFQIL